MFRLFYCFLTYLLVPLLIVRQFWRSRQDPGHRQRLGERLGYVPQLNTENAIHFHLVSVGETLAALPLINAWIDQHPNFQVYVTCTTLTGSREVEKKLGAKVTHAYLPYDTPTAMGRFYRRVGVSLSVIMETELWPNMLNSAKKAGVKTLLMNARLSDRSAARYQKLPSARQLLIEPLTAICCQNQQTFEHFERLGAKPSQLKLTGNLKFDMSLPADLQQSGQDLRTKLGEARPVWIAGSTHEGEDEIALQAHQQLQKELPEALLILVPRHPERFKKVATLIENTQMRYVTRSSGETTQAIDVFLGDTMGELLLMYQAADIAFVGGSMIKRGGHNPLEPAALGRPVLTGPHVFNFTNVYELLSNADACLTCESTEELAHHLQVLFKDRPQYEQMARQGKHLVEQHKGAKQATIQCIDEILGNI